ncbi:MAG TPA: hypothetical protein VF173_27100 [Thermoanaerobaculia bacterium]|nr:hypothetical protein [Thermoanaerobaculia bacterium]
MTLPHLRWWLVAAAVSLAAVAPASGGWLPLGGPAEPPIEIRFDPGRPELLYARVVVADDGSAFLWRSEDGGATWRNVQKGLGRPSVALAIDPANPKVIWVWTADGLWRSGDAGDTWAQRTAASTEDFFLVFQLLVDPRRPSTLYRVTYRFASSSTSVDVSYDGGASFHEGASLPNSGSFVRMGRDGLVSFDQRGLEVSADGGQTWSVRGRYRLGFTSGDVAPSAPGTLYGLVDSCMARSDDGGAHWRRLAPPRLSVPNFGCSVLAIDPRDARHVWTGGELLLPTPAYVFQLSESRDGGETWSGPFTVPKDEQALSLLAAGGDLLYSDRYVSMDAGRTWTRRDRGIATGDARFGLVAQELPVQGGALRLVGVNVPLDSGPDGLFRSHGGRSWKRSLLLAGRAASVADTGAPTLVATGEGNVLHSQDGGDTWSVVPASPPQAILLRSDLTQPRYLTVDVHEDNGGDGDLAVWTSDDAGATWRRASGLLQDCTSFLGSSLCLGYTAYAVDPFDPSRRWIANQANFDVLPLLYVSTDAGASWRVSTGDLPGILALAADPKVQGRLLAGTYEGLLGSDDGGDHWHPLGTGLPDGAGIRHLARDARSATWYAATFEHGIYRSLDGGAHWTLLPGAPDLDTPSITVDPRSPGALLAAFRGQGVWLWTP